MFALDHEVSGNETAAAAAVLLKRVTDARQKGELTEAFTRAAVPVLQALSDPAPYRALRTLVTDAEREPGRLGSAGSQVLKSLRSISSLPVFDAGNAAQDLLVLVQQDGLVTPAFPGLGDTRARPPGALTLITFACCPRCARPPLYLAGIDHTPAAQVPQFFHGARPLAVCQLVVAALRPLRPVCAPHETRR